MTRAGTRWVFAAPGMTLVALYFGYGGDIVEYFGRDWRQLTSRTDIRSVSGLSHADVRRLRALHPVR